MNKLISALLILIAAGLLHCSPGDADNGTLTIHNDCDRAIRVYYAREYESGTEDDGMIETAHEVDSINSGDDITIEAESDIAFNGSIDAVYGGIVRDFDINFDIFDTATIHIYTGDFYGEVE